ncbi:hypothetical protein QVD17_09459 [Tagetes erecta]|uniref:Uncharacterized protein n=1 Tax=Tagetes erecta TaxID=13708 RepID=A0AAD8L0M7_TARER|nr:hypothetical protein QVD17_09459 [Tagetes erecta]
MGDVRPGVHSNPSGLGGYYTSDQPPSHKDVRPIGTSQTGSSITGNPVRGSVAAPPGMSMTAHNFKKYNPTAFKKG